MSVFGGIISWKLSRYGKKKALMISSLITFTGSCLLFIKSHYAMAVARGITGIGFGITNAVAPLFIYEIAKARYIEYCIPTVQVWINIGFLLPLLLGIFLPDLGFPETKGENYWTRYEDSHIVWRELYITVVWVSALQFLLLLLVFRRENPQYEQRGSFRSETMLSETGGGAATRAINSSIDSQQSIGLEKQISNDTWKNLWSIPERRKLIACCIIRSFQQLTGVNILQNYAMSFFFEAEHENLSLRVISFSLALIFSVVQIIPMKLLGRKTLFLIGLIVIWFANWILFQLTDQLTLEDESVEIMTSLPNFISFLWIFIFMIAFWLTLSSAPLMYWAEVLTDKGMAVVTAAHWLLNSILRILPLVLMSVIESFGVETRFRTSNSILFFIFSGFSMLGFIWVTLYLKETKGKSKSEITEEFTKDFMKPRTEKVFDE